MMQTPRSNLSAAMIEANRATVYADYTAAEVNNKRRYVKGDPLACEQYIYQNQKEDALKIMDLFYKENCRVISVQKKTKVGADGLMIEVAKLATMHPDDAVVVNLDNVRILTGMSNCDWEREMKDKSPQCFKDKIYHHGKLKHSDLENMSNSLIIIDEIDSGSKELQVLHQTLIHAGILNVDNMIQNNNRFLFISATIMRELYDLYKWGNLHKLFKMTIPAEYIGHKEFLEKGIIQEFYEMKTKESVETWIREDIIENYQTNYRVHIVRCTEKNIEMIEQTCIENQILFRNHVSNDKLTPYDKKSFFEDALTQHIVIAVKGLFRRANLIPNAWKIRIGAIHESYSATVDNNVQVQGLLGRLTGYWKTIIENGHKTGPYRTSIKAIEEYNAAYEDPFNVATTYQCAGFKKKRAKITSEPTMLHPKNANITVDIPVLRDPKSKPIIVVCCSSVDSLMKENRNGKKMLCKELVRNAIYDHIVLNGYQNYKLHCWNVDTNNKYKKWSIDTLCEPNARSSTTNIRENEMNMNVLHVYVCDNKIVLAPWNGANTDTHITGDSL